MFSMQIFIGLNIKTRLINQGSTIWFNVFEEALDLYGIIIIMHMLWVFMVSRSIIYMLILLVMLITRFYCYKSKGE